MEGKGPDILFLFFIFSIDHMQRVRALIADVRSFHHSVFNYSGTFELDSETNAYLALYGWGFNPNGDVPVVEWYIIEAMGIHNPSDNSSATQYGVMESDGATYEIWMKPNWNGDIDMPFNQYWSIRTSMHCGGTITYGNHFAAWNEVGLEFGDTMGYALSVEGQYGSGHANITVGVLPSTEVAETPTSTYRSENGTPLPTTTTTLTPPYSTVSLTTHTSTHESTTTTMGTSPHTTTSTTHTSCGHEPTTTIVPENLGLKIREFHFFDRLRALID
jgi:endo-1,4-beta-xylanase